MPFETVETTLSGWRSKFAKGSERALLVLFGISVVAWGTELLTPTLNVDDYGQSLRHVMPHWTQLGRWAADLLYYGVLGGWPSPSLHLLLGLVLNVVALLLVVRLWCPDEDLCSLPVIVACALFLAFPYWCDAYSFNTGQVQMPAANLLAIGGYSVVRRTATSLVAGALLIMLSLALYQVAFNFLAVAVVFQLVFALLRSPSVRHFIAWVRSDLPLKIVAMPTGVLLYAISLKIAFAMLPERNSRWSAFSRLIESPSDAVRKLDQISVNSIHHLIAHDVFLPTALKLCMLALVVVGALAAFRSLALPCEGAPRTSGAMAGLGLALAALLALAFVAVYATDLATVGSVLGIGYRHTYPMGLIYCGSFLLGARLLRPVRLRNAYLLVGVFVLTRFVFADNAWSFAQRQLNAFDDTLAARILARIEAHPKFIGFEDSSVAFVGLLPNEAKPAGYSSLPGGVVHSSLNRSVFQATHSQREIFRTKGLELKPPSRKQRELALQYARRHEPWPHADAIAIEGDLIIVALGRPGETPKEVHPNRSILKRARRR